MRAATCTQKGEGINTCSLCGHTEPCEYPKKEHTYDQKTVVKPATCTEKGELQKVCADCGYTAKEVVSALRHSWNNATCQQDKVCTACGAGNGKGDHAYTNLKDRQGSKNFAGYREKKCDICGEEVSEYYVNTVTFDLDAIGAEIVQYAKERGMNARVVKNIPDSDYSYRFAVAEATIAGYSSKTLVKMGKRFVDRYYESMKDYPNSFATRMIEIRVYYTESGALGTGYFGVCTDRSYV